jgi:hypothetical protein
MIGPNDSEPGDFPHWYNILQLPSFWFCLGLTYLVATPRFSRLMLHQNGSLSEKEPCQLWNCGWKLSSVGSVGTSLFLFSLWAGNGIEVCGCFRNDSLYCIDKKSPQGLGWYERVWGIFLISVPLNGKISLQGIRPKLRRDFCSRIQSFGS